MKDSKKIYSAPNELTDSEIIYGNINQDFTSNFIDTYSTLGKKETLGPNITIMSEGKYNYKLYFLISGSVSITINNQLIATLKDQGDLLGEMGLITGYPCSATVTTESTSELYVFDYDQLKKGGNSKTDKLNADLYKVFSKILSKKLNNTNEKAKLFEKMNKQLTITQQELEEANTDLENKIKTRTQDLETKTKELIKSHAELENKNTALIINQKKLEELYNNRNITISMLDKLYNNHLLGLKESLKTKVNIDSQTKLRPIKEAIDNAIAQLKPINELFSSQKALRDQRVLLIESNKKQRTIAKLALGGTGVTLDLANDEEQAKQYLDINKYDILLTETKSISAAIYGYKKNPLMQFVLITSDSIPTYLNNLKANDFLLNVVSKNENDRTFTIKNISTTISKLIEKDLFGLEKYLSWGVEVEDFAVKESKQRKELIAKLQNHFKQLGLRNTVIEKCELVAEELLMNIIYDAPVDEQGNALYNHLPRTVPVTLQKKHYGSFRFACDGMIAAVSVQDPFGALKRETILQYLDSCYSGLAGELNHKKGGGGRGIYQIIEIADLVVFNINPNTMTEVIALFNVDIKATKSIKHPSFHLFYL